MAEELPDGIPLHLKVDTGMGRWGLSDAAATSEDVVGIASHLATADVDAAFTELQIERFAEIASEFPGLTRSLANSAGIFRFPGALFDAARPGLALHGLSPYGTDPADDGLRPVLSWRSRVAEVKQLDPGDSTGYHRRFVATEPTWIGIVPVGYADGWRRTLSGAEVLVGGVRCRDGRHGLDGLVRCPARRPGDPGTPVTLIGDGLLAEEQALAAGTITHDLVTGIDSSPARATRVVTPEIAEGRLHLRRDGVSFEWARRPCKYRAARPGRTGLNRKRAAGGRAGPPARCLVYASSDASSTARWRSSSTTAGSASVVMSPSGRFSATSRSSRRMILPQRVFGSSGVKTMFAGLAIGPIFSGDVVAQLLELLDRAARRRP